MVQTNVGTPQVLAYTEVNAARVNDSTAATESKVHPTQDAATRVNDSTATAKSKVLSA
jgi:hypothetical protein